jgi:hypothetical protein
MISNVAVCYSKLEARVITDQWKASHFMIRQGIFQGDTLSSLLFLIAFQPILHLAEFLELDGYQLKFFIPNSEGLPLPGAHAYVYWDDEASDEPQEWYLCRIMMSKVEYLNSSATEIVDLKSIPWYFARKSARKYLSSEVTSPTPPLKKLRNRRKNHNFSHHPNTRSKVLLMISQSSQGLYPATNRSSKQQLPDVKILTSKYVQTSTFQSSSMERNSCMTHPSNYHLKILTASEMLLLSS